MLQASCKQQELLKCRQNIVLSIHQLITSVQPKLWRDGIHRRQAGQLKWLPICITLHLWLRLSYMIITEYRWTGTVKRKLIKLNCSDNQGNVYGFWLRIAPHTVRGKLHINVIPRWKQLAKCCILTQFANMYYNTQRNNRHLIVLNVVHVNI